MFFTTPTPEDFSKISPHLDVRVSPRARRMALRLDPKTRRVRLVIPKRASLRKAYEFAKDHREWIDSKVFGLPHPIPFVHGEKIPLLDRTITIEVIPSSSRLTRIAFEGDRLAVSSNLDDPSPRITRFLKNHAAKELRVRADEKAARLGRRLSSFAVRDMKSRWGSCSLDGKMALSWRLIFAPEVACDYVVAHEAAHLVHPDHGQRFWALCEELSTDFSTGRDWVRDFGNELLRFGATH
jgi:predicted metal-dependent hydrolase